MERFDVLRRSNYVEVSGDEKHARWIARWLGV
jgi:hypothetical protein